MKNDKYIEKYCIDKDVDTLASPYYELASSTAIDWKRALELAHMDSEKDEITQLIYEAKQNIIDSRLNEDEPYEICISVFRDKNWFLDLGIDQKFSKAYKKINTITKESDLEDIVTLVIEDFNCTGITGNHEDDNSNLNKLFYAGFDTNKKGNAAGGLGVGIRAAIIKLSDQLKNFFILSYRSDDEEEIFFGKAFGDSFKDGADKDTGEPLKFSGIVNYGVRQDYPNATTIPIIEKDLIKDVKDKFFIRKNNTAFGTSLIIPGIPPTIRNSDVSSEFVAREYLKNFFIDIYRGNGKLSYRPDEHSSDLVTIDKENLIHHLEKFNLSKEKFHISDFISEIEFAKSNGPTVKLADDPTRNEEINNDDFVVNEIDNFSKFKDVINENKITYLKIPVPIQKQKDGSSEFETKNGYAELYIKKLKNVFEENTHDAYHFYGRKGHPMTKFIKKLSKNYHVYYDLSEDNLGAMVRTQENAKHDSIDKQRTKRWKDLGYGNQYQVQEPHKVKNLSRLKGVIDAPTDILRMLKEKAGQNKPDSIGWADIFPRETEERNLSKHKIPSQKKKKKGTRRIVKRKVKIKKYISKFNVRDISSGVRISHNSQLDLNSTKFPHPCKIELTRTRIGSKRGVWNKKDFTMQDLIDNQQVTCKGFTILKTENNRLEGQVHGRDFLVDIKGLSSIVQWHVRAVEK